MIPYMNLWHRIIAWALWKLNGWSDPDECRYNGQSIFSGKRESALVRETVVNTDADH